MKASKSLYSFFVLLTLSVAASANALKSSVFGEPEAVLIVDSGLRSATPAFSKKFKLDCGSNVSSRTFLYFSVSNV